MTAPLQAQFAEHATSLTAFTERAHEILQRQLEEGYSATALSDLLLEKLNQVVAAGLVAAPQPSNELKQHVNELSVALTKLASEHSLLMATAKHLLASRLSAAVPTAPEDGV